MLHRLGGLSALRHLKPFPATHLALRAEMAAAGLGESLLEAGIDIEGAVHTKTEAEKREERRKTRVRRPHRAQLAVDLGSLQGTSAGNAVERANLEIVYEKYMADKEAAAARTAAAGNNVVGLRRF